jgi:hypothetical protein
VFGLFGPRCPVNTWEKAWTETRLLWLARALGIKRCLEAETILPTDDYFPDTYSGSFEDVRRMFDFICGYMHVNANQLDLEICEDLQMFGIAGHYDSEGKRTIRVARAQTQTPMSLVKTLAHEIAHEILFGGGLLTGDELDQESLTDLLPVYLGLGIFSANSTVQENYQTSGLAWSWKISRHGYLPARMLSYALALCCHVRGERHPEWSKHLRTDAATALADSLQYLEHTNDTLFNAESAQRPDHTPTCEEAAHLLREGTASCRLATLWTIRDAKLLSPDLHRAVVGLLDDKDPYIPGTAAQTLALFGTNQVVPLPKLLKLLRSSRPETRAEIAMALGMLKVEPDVVISELTSLLDDSRGDVVQNAAWALGQFGHQAQTAVPDLVRAIKRYLIECSGYMGDAVLGALISISADPEQALRDHLPEDDPELLSHGLAELRARTAEGPPQGGDCQWHGYIRGSDSRWGHGHTAG